MNEQEFDRYAQRFLKKRQKLTEGDLPGHVSPVAWVLRAGSIFLLGCLGLMWVCSLWVFVDACWTAACSVW